MKKRIVNIDTDWIAWVPQEAIDRAVQANGMPYDDCFSLMPEDWPEEDTGRDEVLERLADEPNINVWRLAPQDFH